MAACAPRPLIDLENIEGGHHRPGRLTNCRTGSPGQLCIPKTASTGYFPRTSSSTIKSRSALVLLGGPKDEVDGPGKVARLCEVFGRAQQHRGMPIMTAGIMWPRFLRDMREIILFLDVQRIHIGA
jgi:hypothetical protein